MRQRRVESSHCRKELRTVMTDIEHDQPARRDSFGAQAPMALLGLAAIAIIAFVNLGATPAEAVPQAAVAGCGDCGTVVAVHQSAHASPTYFVELRMADGSHRVVQQFAAGFKIGDVVQVNGNALALRPRAS
jgi:hypothetical protein